MFDKRLEMISLIGSSKLMWWIEYSSNNGDFLPDFGWNLSTLCRVMRRDVEKTEHQLLQFI